MTQPELAGLMLIILHKNATTAPAARLALQQAVAQIERSQPNMAWA